MLAIKRAGYYICLSVAGAFFIVQLLRPSETRFHRDMSVDSTVLLVLILVLYIARADRPYLTRSILLRLLMGATSLLGMAVIAGSMGIL